MLVKIEGTPLADVDDLDPFEFVLKKLQKVSITVLKPKVTNSLFPMFLKKGKRLLSKLKKKNVATKVLL